MLFRVRTTLADRPGALATLAARCGQQDVNILALQIFPGLSGVTDELVLRAPEEWAAEDVVGLVEGAGGTGVAADVCTEHALVDGPIAYLHALRRVAEDATTLPRMLAGLLDAEPAADPDGPQDTLTVEVGSHRLTVGREAPFTTTELARAVAFAEVATELLDEDPAPRDEVATGPTPADGADPVVRMASFDDTASLMRMHQRCSADSVYRRYAAPLARIDERFARRLLLAGGGALVAVVEDEVVGVASVSTCEAGVVEVAILVEDGWQRRGLGSQLLSTASRVARGHGASEVVLRSRTHNPALMSLAFASGLRARIKLDGDTVVVTVGVDGLKPSTLVPASTTRPAASTTGRFR